MPRIYDSIDFDFTYDGDFVVDETGDIADTADDLLRSIKNEIFSYVISDLQDWREHPNIGSDLADFVGEPNVKATAEAIQSRLQASLSQIVASSDLGIRVVPVGIHKVLIILNILVKATVENRRQSGDTISISFLYDYFDRGVFVPIEEMNKLADRKI